jgi:hypothetical protein
VAPTSPKAPRTRQAAPDEATTGVDVLAERYEQLRAAVLDSHPGGAGLGLGVLAGRGLAAWITVWRSGPPPACWVPSAARIRNPPATAVGAGTTSSELVGVLAAMALAHL